MKSKLSSLIIITSIAIGSFFLPTLPTFADTCSEDVPDAVKQAAGCFNNANSLPSVIQTILNIIIGVCSLVAVTYVIVGGYNYMTSSGDAAKIEKAKKTIMYAVIGLIVCALSFVIVNWVITGVLQQ